MKKINYFLLLLLSITTNAQTIPVDENISLDQQLTNINQSSVRSGIIYERVMQIANIYNFNTTSTFNTANFNYFKQALDEMNRSSNGTKFITLDNFKNLISTTTDLNQVDLSILNTQYHVLNYNDENTSLGGMTYNTSTNKFVQISGKVPFYMLNTTIISPTKDYISGTSVIYKIRNDLYFKNGTKNIKTLVANFGDGINRTLINSQLLTNQNITINYTNSGEKTSTFTITYTDNSTLTTYGKIYFKYETVGSKITDLASCFAIDPYKQDFQLQADIPFTGYATGDPTVKAKIDYRVFYAFAHTDKKVRKPIIIIDGFDPGDKRKIEDCDCENIPDCASRNTTSGVFNSEKHRAMVDLMEYYEGPNKRELMFKLRTEGYDVIMVNHPKYTAINLQNGQNVTIDGGAYYIESNAMALVKLLIQTKQLLVINGSTNNIAIVGPSMAGQISRYALSYMEKNGIPHNTYLWVSVDSPHLGANVPLGDQALLNLVKTSSNEAKDFYDKELASPASQQQLIEFHREEPLSNPILGLTSNYHLVDQNYLNAQTISQGMPINRGNSFFQQLYNNQNSNGLPGSNGWPLNLRKIALVNGSLSGSKETLTLNGQPFYTFANNNEKVLNLRGFQRVNINLPIGSITFRIHIASLEANFLPANGSGFTQIARFKKLFNDRTTRSPNYNIRGNMDNIPGGYFGAQNEIVVSTQGTNPVPGTNLSSISNWSTSNFSINNFLYAISEKLGGSEWYLHDFNPIHSFIPSFSALAHLQPNQSWANPLNTNLKCTSNNLTPFDSYFGLSKNTQHTSFTKESVAWLLKELAGQPQTPWFPIQDSALNGPNTLCLNSNSTFVFNDLCKVPSSVIWTVQGNLSIVSFTDYSVVVTATSNILSEGKIIATFQNGEKFEKIVSIGKPTVNSNIIIGSNTSEPINTTSQLSTAWATGATGYQWTVNLLSNVCVDANGVPLSGTILPKFSNGSNTITTVSPIAFVNWGSCPNDVVVNCSAVNICGSSPIGYKIVRVYGSGSGGGDPCVGRMTISPNPIKEDEIISVNIADPIDPCGPSSSTITRINNDVKIYDLLGNLLYEKSYDTNSFVISGLRLSKGHYIINAFSYKGYTSRQIIIIE